MDIKALHKISYGIYILTSGKDDKFNGQIANAVIQVSSEPATIAVSVNKKNLTHEFIETAKVFTLSVLGENAPMSLIAQFGFKSGREVDKFAGVDFKTGKNGVPIVTDSAVAFLELELISRTEAGTHTVFVGRVVNGEILSDENPMTYAYYHQIKGGSSPKTAPHYIEPEKTESTGLNKYVCGTCGYVYDPEKGDPDAGIEPVREFGDLPDGWVCPVCGVSKDEFQKKG